MATRRLTFFHIPLKIKITGIAVSVIIIGMVLSAVFDSRLFQQREELADASIADIYQRVLFGLFEVQQVELQQKLRFLVSSPELIHVFENENVHDVDDVLFSGMFLSLKAHADISLLAFFDQEFQNVFYETDEHFETLSEEAFDLPYLRAIAQTTAETWEYEYTLLETKQNICYCVITSIINDHDEVVGYMLAGKPIKTLAEALAESVRYPVFFENSHHVFIAGTDRAMLTHLSEHPMHQEFGKETLEFHLEDIWYKAYTHEIRERTSATFIGRLWVVNDYQTAHELAEHSRMMSILANSTLVVVLGLILYALTARILNPLGLAVRIANSLAQGAGDLTQRMNLRSRDEVGRLGNAIDLMLENLNNLIKQVQQSGIKVISTATQLSASAQEQEATLFQQMASINKVVKSLQDISDATVMLVETMEQVSSMTEETAGFANSGQEGLERMEDAMQQMEEASRSISSKLSTISEKTENITSVVTTITKVADQTNLLSLNAAVEAEKAGEYGRGFTVVAREIRRLADQTAVATLDIEQMVHEMENAVSSGVMEMDKFIAKVRHNADDVGQISLQLSRIIEQVQALAPNFEHVSTTMEQQSKSAQDINTTMANLKAEMEQTTSSLRETFLSIDQLKEAAKGLQNEVSRFKVD